jgi:hypothetical protein
MPERKILPDLLQLSHYVIEIGPQSAVPTSRVIRQNFAEKFGESFFIASENAAELAFGRVFENFTKAEVP